jgi:DNA-directed RNA polymerase specialized sigma24 family protein
MRASWEALQESLSRSIRTFEAAEQFRILQSQRQGLGAFAEPVALAAWLADRAVDPGERNEVYIALVELAQQGEEGAMPLLWLGLLPALEAIYRRQRRFWHRNPDGLVSEIASAFSQLVQRMDLSRVNRIAATLVRSTERDVCAERQRTLPKHTHEVELPDDFDLVDPVSTLSANGDAEAVRRLLLPVVGHDAELVISVVVMGQTQAEAAVALGIPHDAARKRFQRALARLQKHFGSACPNSTRGSA